MALRGKILAPVALIAGAVADRPVSGKWLARYFWGSGGEISLPPHLERKVFAMVDELFRLEGLGGGWKPYTPNSDEDLYTCVGTFSAQVLEDGSIEYRDVYDWHSGMGWSFAVGPSWLPFSFEVRGTDELFGGGKEFLTMGIISAQVGGGASPTLRKTSLQFLWHRFKMRVRERCRRILRKPVYLGEETLAKLDSDAW